MERIEEKTANLFVGSLSLFLFEEDFREVWKEFKIATAILTIGSHSPYFFQEDFREVLKRTAAKKTAGIFLDPLFTHKNHHTVPFRLGVDAYFKMQAA